MYKCSECGTEYEIAPKYCDCGNDIFISTEDIEPQEIEDIFDDEEYETPKHRNLKHKSFSPFSISIFVLCIILSLLIIFVFGNPKKSVVENVVKNNLDEKTQIPEIDSFWDNTSVKIAKTEQAQEQDDSIINIMPKIVQQIIPAKSEIKTDLTIKKTPVKTEQKQQTKPLTTQNTQTQKNTKPQTKQTSQTQPSTQTNNSQIMTFGDLTNKIKNQYYASQTSNSVSNSNSQTTQTQSAQPKTINNTPQNTPVKTTTAQTTAASSTHVQTQANTSAQQVTAPVVPAKSAAQLKQELAAYKSNLRNAIGKKIDFTRVIGDGECSLSFKINSNGRLTSKAFTKQSSNMTLNDAAFNALNTMTSFNPPPEAYNGETLKLIIKFYNGNFEISLN